MDPNQQINNLQNTIHPIEFAVNSYKSRSGIASSENVLNFYAEPTPVDSPFKAATIFNTPGLKLWKNLVNFSPISGMIVMSDILYVVCGATFYKIDTSKTVTVLGTLNTTPDTVQMTYNGTQITILTTSGISYYYDASSNIFGQITNVNYQNASSVTTLDSYTIFSKQESSQFFISALGDTTSYAALDFATAESILSKIVRVFNYNRQLYIFGETATEMWYDTGSGTFPFQRIDGALMQRGLGAVNSIAMEVDGIYWLGEDRMFYKTKNYIPQKISTFAIEEEIASYATVSDAMAFMYTQAGHKFYCVTFPSAKKTWVYDLVTNLWHQRGSLNTDQTTISSWNCTISTFFNGTVLVNGINNGKIYQLDLNTYTEDGVPIISEIITATQFDGYNYKNIDRLGVMMDFGVGVNGGGQGINPKVIMSYSLDGGNTWTSTTTASLGDIGQYQQELYWERLGKCRSIIFKLRISDPVERTIVGGYLKLKTGAF